MVHSVGPWHIDHSLPRVLDQWKACLQKRAGVGFVSQKCDTYTHTWSRCTEGMLAVYVTHHVMVVFTLHFWNPAKAFILEVTWWNKTSLFNSTKKTGRTFRWTELHSLLSPDSTVGAVYFLGHLYDQIPHRREKWSHSAVSTSTFRWKRTLFFIYNLLTLSKKEVVLQQCATSCKSVIKYSARLCVSIDPGGPMTGVFALNNCDYSRHQFGQHFSDSIGAFQQPRTKGMQFRTRNIIPEVWNEILPTESHILWLQTPSLLPHLRSHTHTHREHKKVFMSNTCYWFVACNCKQRSRKWSKSQLLTRTRSHTELKHRGGGFAAENTSILLFRKGALLEDWKQINAKYRPRRASPVNCTQRAEQNNKNHHWDFYWRRFWPLRLTSRRGAKTVSEKTPEKRLDSPAVLRDASNGVREPRALWHSGRRRPAFPPSRLQGAKIVVPKI